MCRTHKVVVDSVGEMVGRDSVGFEKDEVLVVFGNFKRTLYKVGEFYLFVGVAERENTKHEGMSCFDVFFNLFNRKVAAREHFMSPCLSLSLPIGVLNFLFFIYGLQFVKFFLGRKARVCLALADELLCEHLVYLTSLTLLVGTVCALVRDVAVLIEYRTLVEVYAVFCKSLY